MNDRAETPKQTVAKGFMVLTVAMIAVKIIGVVYTPAMNYILEDVAYGIYSKAYTIFTYIYTLANSGIQAAIAKVVSELEAKGNYKDATKAFKAARFLFLAVGAVLGLGLFLFAEPISIMFKSSRSSLAIMCLAPGILFTTLMCAYKGYFQGTGNMTPISIALVGEQILNLIFSLTFAAMLIGNGDEFGAAGGTIGTIVGAIGASLYMMWAYRTINSQNGIKKNKPGVKRLSNESIVKSIVKYAVPITIGSALQQSGTLVDISLVSSRLLHNGLDKLVIDAQYGYLSLYNTLISVPMAIIGALATAILPAISRVSTTNDKKNLRLSIKSTYRVTFIISLPCAVGLSVLALPITKILNYNPMVADLLMWGAWSLVLFAMTLIQTSILQGMGKMTLVTVYSVIGIIVKFIVSYILIGNPDMGLMGAIWGNAACYLVIVVLFQTYINKSLGIIRVLPCLYKPLISGLGMGVVTYFTYKFMSIVFVFIPSLYLANLVVALITIGVSIPTYGMILIFSGGLRKTDFRVVPAKLLKLIPKKLYEYIQ